MDILDLEQPNDYGPGASLELSAAELTMVAELQTLGMIHNIVVPR